MSQLISLALVRMDGGTQPRAFINSQTVEDYAEDMSNGTTFPPIDVFFDGETYYLGDGFHRTLAAQRLGKEEIAANIHQGTKEDAQWFSFGVNKNHGLRRTNQDKQRAVEAALKHPRAASIGIREIARHCGVSEGYVHKKFHETVHREQINTPRNVTRNGTMYTLKTGNIGKNRKPAPKRGDTVTFERQGEVREGILKTQPKNGHAEVWTSETASSFVPVSKLTIVAPQPEPATDQIASETTSVTGELASEPEHITAEFRSDNLDHETQPSSSSPAPPEPAASELPDPRLVLVEQANTEQLREFARDHLNTFAAWLEEQS